MLKSLVALIFLTATGHAAVQVVNPKDNSFPPAEAFSTPSLSYMVIPPAARAADFQQAFELLRKEKTTTKVFFQIADGTIINNIIDMNLMPNSTLILFRYNSNQGIKYQVVKVEDITMISYN